MRVKKFLASSATLPLTPMDFRTPLRSLQLMSLTEMVQLKCEKMLDRFLALLSIFFKRLYSHSIVPGGFEVKS